MGFKDIFKKPVPLLKQEDVEELREIERKSYLEEAKKIVLVRGSNKAKKDYGVLEPKPIKPINPWA